MRSAEVDAERAGVEERLCASRDRLLGGRGPGASEAEIAAHTRRRLTIAGTSVTRRLELQARQTSRARGDAAGIVDAIELSRQELAVTAGELARRGRRLLAVGGRNLMTIAGAVLLVRTLARRRRRLSAVRRDGSPSWR